MEVMLIKPVVWKFDVILLADFKYSFDLLIQSAPKMESRFPTTHKCLFFWSNIINSFTHIDIDTVTLLSEWNQPPGGEINIFLEITIGTLKKYYHNDLFGKLSSVMGF